MLTGERIDDSASSARPRKPATRESGKLGVGPSFSRPRVCVAPNRFEWRAAVDEAAVDRAEGLARAGFDAAAIAETTGLTRHVAALIACRVRRPADFTDEQQTESLASKADRAARLLQSGLTIAATAQALRVCPNSIRNWRQQFPESFQATQAEPPA